MFKEAIILAGGFGTRLQSVVNDRPKVLAPVRSRPFLSWILDYLEEAGVAKVILATGYMHEAVEETFQNQYKEIEINYSRNRTIRNRWSNKKSDGADRWEKSLSFKRRYPV